MSDAEACLEWLDLKGLCGAELSSVEARKVEFDEVPSEFDTSDERPLDLSADYIGFIGGKRANTQVAYPN